MDRCWQACNSLCTCSITFLTVQRISKHNSSFQLLEYLRSLRMSMSIFWCGMLLKRHLFIDFDFHIYDHWKKYHSLLKCIFWFFPTRQEGVYIQWETEVCRLFSVPEEEMGHWLSSKVQLSILETDARWTHWGQVSLVSGQSRSTATKVTSRDTLELTYVGS